MTSARHAALAVAVLAVLVYANAAPNGFALDDRFIIVDNPRVHGIERIPAAVTEPYWPEAPGRLALYRPLTMATYAVEWELWGNAPLPFHLTNIALHALASALVFTLLLAVLGTPAARGEAGAGGSTPLLGATIGAALFAVHPVHVEAVANTVGRAELLAAVFILLAALVYLRGDLTRSAGRLWGAALAVALAYFLGLASKEVAVTLPGLLLVLEAGRGPGRRPGGAVSSGKDGDPGAGPRAGQGHALREYGARVAQRWPIYLGLAVALGTYLLARSAVLGTAVGNDPASAIRSLDTAERIMTAVSVWPEYLRLMILPVELVADYSPGVLMPVHGLTPAVVLGLLVGALAALVVASAWHRERSVSLGVLLFAVAVLPVSNLVIPIGVLLAERTLYLPSVGFALAVAGAWRWLVTSFPARRTAVFGLLGLAILLAGIRTAVRNSTWRSTETVIETLARDHPESFRVQWIRADRLMAAGQTDQALEHFRRAATLVPNYQLLVQYGRALLDAGRTDRAAETFRTARDAVPDLLDAHVFLMIALLRADRPADAVAAGRAALRRHPDHRAVHHQLAIALTRTGDYPAALEARRQSIRLGGQRASWHQFVHEAELLLRLDRQDEAGTALADARRRARDPAAVPSPSALRQAVDTANPAVLPYR